MTNFRFFSCGGQNKFTGCHSFFYVPCKKLTIKMEKMFKINPVVTLHYVLHWQTDTPTCVTFWPIFEGLVEAFRGKIAKIGVHNLLLLLKNTRIRETKHLSTDADSSTDAIGGWTKNTPKPNFFWKREKIIQNAKTSRTRRGSPVDDRLSPD
jgi:hypothetical protein